MFINSFNIELSTTLSAICCFDLNLFLFLKIIFKLSFLRVFKIFFDFIFKLIFWNLFSFYFKSTFIFILISSNIFKTKNFLILFLFIIIIIIIKINTFYLFTFSFLFKTRITKFICLLYILKITRSPSLNMLFLFFKITWFRNFSITFISYLR